MFVTALPNQSEYNQADYNKYLTQFNYWEANYRPLPNHGQLCIGAYNQAQQMTGRSFQADQTFKKTCRVADKALRERNDMNLELYDQKERNRLLTTEVGRLTRIANRLNERFTIEEERRINIPQGRTNNCCKTLLDKINKLFQQIADLFNSIFNP